MKTLTTIALALTITAASSGISQAGDNRCVGVITASWQPLMRVVDDQGEAVCRFDHLSKVGQQILRTCPVDTPCEIALPLPRSGVVPTTTGPQLITRVDWVKRWPQ